MAKKTPKKNLCVIQIRHRKHKAKTERGIYLPDVSLSAGADVAGFSSDNL